MKRRNFLRTSSFMTLPLCIRGINITAINRSNLFHFIDGESENVLVLVNLIGGNDGLNTLIPLDQYDMLANVRSNLIIPEAQLLQINDINAFHPSCQGLKTMFEQSKLSIIQNVGYPNQNRSHFRSSDIWNTASDADEFLTTGWLGRFFDDRFPDFPEGFPNEEEPDPIAITLGYIVSETCQGQSGNFSIAINNPESLALLQEPIYDDVPDNCYGNELNFVRDAVRQTNAYATSVSNAIESGTNQSAKYDENDGLASQLKIVAQLISGGLKTKVYVVSIGGFDTHANQAEEGDAGEGQHAELLSRVSSAICAFQEDLQLQGLEEKVIGMTFSEFGRRIRSNVSLGTDHGSAAPVFVFGKCVNSGILGDNPEIFPETGIQDGVPMQYDFRSVYGSILMDWFGVSESDIRDILFEEFTYLPIVNGCFSTSVEDPEAQAKLVVEIYPNPVSGTLILQWSLDRPVKYIRIYLYDALGNEIKTISDTSSYSGPQIVPIECHDLPAGNYFIRVVSPNAQLTRSIQKV